MTDQAGGGRRQTEERRHLWDRRAETDRRRAERRVSIVPVRLERRSGGDRRVEPDRRTGFNRRDGTDRRVRSDRRTAARRALGE